MKFIKEVREGEMIPPFHGIAWREFERDCAIALPVPLNWLASIARNVWFFLQFGNREIYENQREAYAQGYRNGKRAAKEPKE